MVKKRTCYRYKFSICKQKTTYEMLRCLVGSELIPHALDFFVRVEKHLAQLQDSMLQVCIVHQDILYKVRHDVGSAFVVPGKFTGKRDFHPFAIHRSPIGDSRRERGDKYP